MASLFRLVTISSPENPDVGDLEMLNGQFVPAPEGSDMLRQRIRCRLLWLQGEWYQDQRQGTPWFTDFMRKGATDDYIRAGLKRLIESIPGVGSVASLSLVRSGRDATVEIEVVAEEGYTLKIADLDLPYGVS